MPVRFSLRTLLALTLLLGLLMGWVVRERQKAQHEQQIAGQLLPKGFVCTDVGHPFWVVVTQSNQGNTWWQEPMRRILGGRVFYVWARDEITEDISALVEFQDLKGLDLSRTRVKDIAPLAKLTKLQEVSLGHSQVNDLKPLAELKDLRELEIQFTQVTDLAPLARLTKLTKLDIRDLRVTKDQVDALKKSLPNCAIEHGVLLDSEPQQPKPSGSI